PAPPAGAWRSTAARSRRALGSAGGGRAPHGRPAPPPPKRVPPPADHRGLLFDAHAQTPPPGPRSRRKKVAALCVADMPGEAASRPREAAARPRKPAIGRTLVRNHTAGV